MLAIDLHVHSNRSDGTFSPSALVDYAMEKGLGAFALTDHDTVEGLEEALEYAQRLKARLGPLADSVWKRFWNTLGAKVLLFALFWVCVYRIVTGLHNPFLYLGF